MKKFNIENVTMYNRSTHKLLLFLNWLDLYLNKLLNL